MKPPSDVFTRGYFRFAGVRWTGRPVTGDAGAVRAVAGPFAGPCGLGRGPGALLFGAGGVCVVRGAGGGVYVLRGAGGGVYVLRGAGGGVYVLRGAGGGVYV